MAEAQDDSGVPAAAPKGGPDMTVAEMREWLRNWIGEATGQSPDSISESVPMVELGLSSRDAVAMASDIEDLTGVTLTATVAFRHPTIESLATVIIEGEPEEDTAALDAEDWSRDVDEGVANIAIVGVGTRFPGDMDTPEQMWAALLDGRDAITDLPEGRWSEFLSEPRIAERVAKARTRGGYLSDIKGFDAEFFALSKMEADNMDPQQRMALELTWEALEHARIPASSLRGENVGVYIGSSTNDYSFLGVADPATAHPYAITGTASSIIANRVSYFYDFRGPSMAIDTACSSSLVAVHEGVKALRNGDADVVVAGGVNALVTPLVTVGFDEVGGVLAPDGRIKSFSADADGYARSEGGGMLVLKRLADARRDGDEILAVIAGGAVNHDGRSNGLLAPNPDAQEAVLRKAYKDAGINPRAVDYIEAHGTGTILGDPIEADALGRVVGRGRADDKPALLGAVKSNVGHLESAAGAASLAKVALALRNNKIPPSINYSGPNPYIDFDKEHLRVTDTVTDWPRYSGYAVAGVSGFGFGGANAHLVLREVLPTDLVEPAPEPDVAVVTPATDDAKAVYVGGVRMDEYGEFLDDEPLARRESGWDDDALDTPASYEDEPELPGLTDEALRLLEVARAELAATEAENPHKPIVPLAVSGFLTSRKRAAAAELADWMETPAGRESSLESIGRSLSRRNHGRSRAVVLAHDHDEAIKGLRALAEGKPSPLVLSADGPVTNGPVWVLAGFGAQHRKMGKSLYLRNETFAEWINKVDALIQDERGHSIVEMILDDAIDYTDETTELPIEKVQLVIFAIQIALGAVLEAHGAKPGALIGQSLGEAAAAYFSGGLSLEDATRTICSRAHLMGEGEAMLFGEYIRLMALVEYSADEIVSVFGEDEAFKNLEVCVYAAPIQTVIGGPPDEVDAIIARAESEGKFARKFQTKGASHTSQMDPLLGELAAELQGIEAHPLQVPYYSTVHEGSLIRAGADPIHDVDYWKKGLRHSVYFTQGIRNAIDNGHTTFLELAPNPVALMQVGLTTAAAGLHDAQLIATLARKQDEVDSMTTAMAQLFVYGHDLDFRTLFPRRSRGLGGALDFADIPPTRFKRKPHWLDAHFTGDSSAVMPGNHVATPDGRHVFEYLPRGATDLAALVKAAAAVVLPDAKLTASEQRAVPADGARLVTTLTRHPGGASVQVHARIEESFTLVYDAIVTRGGAQTALPTAVGAGTVAETTSATTPEPEPEEDNAAILQDNLTAGAGLAAGFAKWSPDSGETIGQRLGAIVGGAMGYEPEDLPWEVPLIELGLDSLMAVRIKNRVEYDFDLPPIQLTAVRDANLYAVEKLITYAVEHRDEVDQIAESQKGQTAEEIAAAQAELMGGATTVAELEAKLAEAGHPIATDHDDAEQDETVAAAGTEAPPSVSDIPAPPTDPSGPSVPAPPTDPSGPSAERSSGSDVSSRERSSGSDVSSRERSSGSDVSSRERSSVAGLAAKVLTQEAVTEALGADVPPRDAAERVTFATWAIVTGTSPGGIFNELPTVDDAVATKIADRLSERAEGTITAEQVGAARTIQDLATVVRDVMDAGEVDGFVRTLRARPEGSNRVPVFVFHPAGGSTVVYEPLMKRLPPDTPVYGIERVEGSVEERAREYVPKLREIQGEGPFILAGWSLGGALAYACAVGLRSQGADVRFVGLIDTVRPGEEIPQTKEETRARWDRYALFAQRTFNVEVPPIPYEELEALDDEGQVQFILDAVKQSGVDIPGGIIEHQRTSYLDNRLLETAEIQPYDGHVTLYMADRYHDDAIFFEPRYGIRQPDGGWGEFVADLEVVPIGGEHIQAIDEPYIAKVGAHMSEAISKIQSEA